MTQEPSVGRIVHYVSYGTPGAEFTKACRAAVVTEVSQVEGAGLVGLAVLNPTGMFFHPLAAGGCIQDEGAETPGDPHCPIDHQDSPHRYCACGWMAADLKGGTWHWPKRV